MQIGHAEKIQQTEQLSEGGEAAAESGRWVTGEGPEARPSQALNNEVAGVKLIWQRIADLTDWQTDSWTAGQMWRTERQQDEEKNSD